MKCTFNPNLWASSSVADWGLGWFVFFFFIHRWKTIQGELQTRVENCKSTENESIVQIFTILKAACMLAKMRSEY